MIRLSDANSSLHLIPLFLVLLLIERAVVIALRLYRIRRFAAENGCLAGKKYKQTDVYLGLCLLFRIVRDFRARRLLHVWQIHSTRVGQTFSFWLLGKRMFVTAEPENVKALLASSFNDFDHGPSRRYALQPLMGDGIFAADGAKWFEARALLRPSFARSQLCDVKMLGNHYDNFVKALPRDGDSVDLQELFKRLTMDIITDMLFGASTGALTQWGHDEATAFSHACQHSLRLAWQNITLGWLGTLLPGREDSKSRQLLHNTVDHWVKQILECELDQTKTSEEVEKDNGRRYVFLDHLAERTRDPKVLRDQLISALLGGRDTTSSLLSNLIHVLARRPDIWLKLRTEAMAFGTQTLTQERMKNATYLRHCLHEC